MFRSILVDKDVKHINMCIERCKRLHQLAILKGDYQLAKEQEERVQKLRAQAAEAKARVEARAAEQTVIADLPIQENLPIRQGQMPQEEEIDEVAEEFVEISEEQQVSPQAKLMKEASSFASKNKILVGAGVAAAIYFLFFRKKGSRIRANPFLKNPFLKKNPAKKKSYTISYMNRTPKRGVKRRKLLAVNKTAARKKFRKSNKHGKILAIIELKKNGTKKGMTRRTARRAYKRK